MSYLVNNCKALDRMKEIDIEIDTASEVEQIKLGEEYSLLEDNLHTVESVFESAQNNYANVYYGQQGNGHYYTGRDEYEDYIYATDDDGKDIVIAYITTGPLTPHALLHKAWIV